MAARPLLSSLVLKSIISASVFANGPNPTGKEVAEKSPGKLPSFCFQRVSKAPATTRTGIKFSVPILRTALVVGEWWYGELICMYQTTKVW